jgi:hypothetical protein
MPQMRKSIDPSKGAILEVTLKYPLSRAHPGTISLTRNVDLLIDTGAEDSFIYESVVTTLLLPFLGVRDIGSANNSQLTTANLIDIEIPALGITYSDIVIVSLPRKPKNAHGLLGRDVLNGGRFEYDGVKAEFILSLP